MTLQPKEPAKELGRRSRQLYLEQARQVIGEGDLDYPTLYQRFALNDWAAIKLDDAVAQSALKAGMTPQDAVNMLHQGPYIQYQIHTKQVPVLAMSQYARGVVLQVLHQLQRSRHRKEMTQHPF
ncbi:MAG TPA: hypothetical protein V6C78_00940 [Crinalium sp.]|jgi:hypothetical protein